MKSFILTILILSLSSFSAQAKVLAVKSLDKSFLTAEAKSAIIEYVNKNCQNIAELNENSTALYTENNAVNYKLGSYIDFSFSNDINFDRVEIMISEMRENINSSWIATIIGFDGAAESCRNL